MADKEIDHQKLAYFQEITGVKDSSLSHQVLDAYGWDLDSAIHAMVDKHTNEIPEYEESIRVAASGSSDVQPDVHANLQAITVETDFGLVSGSSSTPPDNLLAATVPVNEQRLVDDRSLFEQIGDGEHPSEATGEVQGADGTTFAWRVVTLPFLILRGSYNLIYGVVGLGLLLAGGLLSAGLGMHNSSWSPFLNYQNSRSFTSAWV